MANTPHNPGDLHHTTDPDEAARFLHGFRSGTLLAGDVPSRCDFVIDGRDGSLRFPCGVHVLDAGEVVLHLPEETLDSTMQLLLAVEEFDTDDETRDRWSAAHGETELPRWARARIDSVRYRDEVIDGHVLMKPNPLRTAESRLCKRANSNESGLIMACARVADLEPADPVCVGVDPWGMDVRALFGVVRIEFPEPVVDEATAERAVDRALRVTA